MVASMVNLNNAPEISLLSTITDDHGDWNILVRVLRMWQVPDVNPTKLPWSLELVLMDSEGTRIHSTVKKQLLYKFEKEICEGRVYYMAKFAVAANIGDYRTNNHPFKLNFHLHTKIRKANNAMVPPAIYTFTPLANCFMSEFDSGILVDIIGVLTGVGQQRDYVRNGVKSRLITIELDNMGKHFSELMKEGRILSVKVQKHLKNGKNVPTGFGFVEFDSMEAATNVCKDLQNEGKVQKTVEKDKSSTKLLVRNVAFEATEKDLRLLFSKSGQIKSLRLPMKFRSHRGFAFVEYVTQQEAQNALTKLSSTHLYGRHLVIERAKKDESLEELRTKLSKKRKHISTLDDGKIKFERVAD